MQSINPKFTMTEVQNSLDNFKRHKFERIRDTLCNIGEQFVNDARGKTKAHGGFGDVTGNLRASIGYAVLLNGKIITDCYGNDSSPESHAASRKLIDELSKKYNDGFVLICFAGMEYAASVESKGYDVITGSVPAGNLLKESMKTILK